MYHQLSFLQALGTHFITGSVQGQFLVQGQLKKKLLVISPGRIGEQ